MKAIHLTQHAHKILNELPRRYRRAIVKSAIISRRRTNRLLINGQDILNGIAVCLANLPVS